ncbi:unnamed protein product [Ectocarpus fasciculatus]
MLGADQAAVFVVAVVLMVLVKRLRRGGRFIEDQVSDEDAQEAAEETVKMLKAQWQQVSDELDDETRQRIITERAVETQGEAHRYVRRSVCRLCYVHLAATQWRQEEELAQVHELLATANNDNVALRGRAAATELTVEGLHRDKDAVTRAAAQQQDDNEARLAAAQEQLVASQQANSLLTDRAVALEGTIEDMHRDQDAATRAAGHRLEETEARLAATQQHLVASQQANSLLTERAAAAERTIEEVHRNQDAAAVAAKQRREQEELASARLDETTQARLAALQQQLAASQQQNSLAEEQRAATAKTSAEELDKRFKAAGLREEHLRHELDQMCLAPSIHSQGQSGVHTRNSVALGRHPIVNTPSSSSVIPPLFHLRRAEKGTGQWDAPTLNVDEPEAPATPTRVKTFELTGFEEMATYTNPVVENITPWTDGSVMISLDNCGNCYQSSWFVVTVLWAVQCPRRLQELIIKLLHHGYSPGGALVRVPIHCQVQLFLFSVFSCFRFYTYFED